MACGNHVHASFMTEVLIIKPSSLGDILNGLQVAETIKQGRPDVRISWVVADAFEAVVRDALTVDRHFVFPRRGGLRGFCRLARQLRRERFDVVLDMQGLARSGMLTGAARSTRKIGRSDAREGAGIFYDERVPLPDEPWREHSVAILLEFCRVFGLSPELKGAVQFRRTEEFRFGELFETRGGLGPVVMFPDSRGADREWPGFAGLTQRFLSAHAGARVVWAGQKVVPPPRVDPLRFQSLMGLTTLPETIEIVSRAALVVVNDSGPMHLAAALGVPTLAVFGPTTAAMRAPYPPGQGAHRYLEAPDRKITSVAVDEAAAVLTEMWRARGGQ